MNKNSRASNVGSSRYGRLLARLARGSGQLKGRSTRQAAYDGRVGYSLEALEPRVLLSSYTFNSLGSFTGPWATDPAGNQAANAGLVKDTAGDLFGVTSYGGTGYGSIFEDAHGTNAMTTLATFNGTNGANPNGPLVIDGSGDLFGSTPFGGTGNNGTVFELPHGASSVSTLATFTSATGLNPIGGLVADSNGELFGATLSGGAHSEGTLFEIPQGGTGATVLASFTSAGGYDPVGGLVIDGSGDLFGAGISGGANGVGSVFELVKGKSTVTTLASFVFGVNSESVGGMVLSGGNLFGTTEIGGGGNGEGTLFEVAAGTNAVTTVASFGASNEWYPEGSLVADTNGDLFGTTLEGGTFGTGTVFELPVGSSSLTALTNFSPSTLNSPSGALVRDTSGNLFGVATAGSTNGSGAVFELAAGSGTATTLGALPGGDGKAPNTGLVRDSSGDLFGTSNAGGAHGYGTVFEIPAGGTLTTLASFNGTNGNNPSGTLVLDSHGNLYGTTYGGGTAGDGTVFEVASGSNAITAVASFNFANNGGWGPLGGVITDTNGDFFGTTENGGTGGDGTVFELPHGSSAITTLASFTGANGESPASGLVMDGHGNLFGSTGQGGANGDGAVFEVTAGSGSATALASFNQTNGADPIGNLAIDGAGDLFGTTAYGMGTVFELPAGSATVTSLATFSTNFDDPGSVIRDTAGDLFGTTSTGGTNNQGMVFELAAGTNTISSLFSFNQVNGENPSGVLLMDGSGNLYGTTAIGGAANDGTVFELSPPAAAPTAAVTGNGNAIANGESLPTTTNATNFGTVLYGGPSVTETYTITNMGTAALTIGTITAPEFTVAQPLSTTLAPNSSTTFTVTLQTSAIGVSEADVSIPTNDPNNNPYVFLVKGSVTIATAGVTGNGQGIANGESTPSAANGTNFGTVSGGSSAVIETYTIKNSGTATLTLGTVTVPSGFTVTQPLSSSVAPNASTTFTVTMPTSAFGTFSGNVSIPTSDPFNNPFVFKITGQVNASLAAVSANAQPIADGSTVPSAANDTAFGTVVQNSAAETFTYTIKNNGNATLTIPSNITVPAGFTVTQPASTSITPSFSTTFTITLSTTTLGTFSGNVVIPTNDPLNNPYVFAISGTVGNPVVSISGNGNLIPNPSHNPSATTGTQFGTVFVGAPTVVETYTIANSGSANLLITGNITAGTGVTVTQPLTTTIPPNQSTTFTVSMPTTTPVDFLNNVIVPTNDPNNASYLFEIAGNVIGPDPSVSGNGNPIANGENAPGQSNDTAFGSVQDGSADTQTYTITNIGVSTLMVNVLSVPAHFTATQPLSESLAPNASTTFTVSLTTSVTGTFSGNVVLGTNSPQADAYGFEVSGTVTPGPATHLAVTQSPAGAAAGITLGSMTVSVEDALNNVVTTDGSMVTAGVATGPAGVVLGGTTSEQAVNGVATFNAMVLNTAGNYTLGVTDGALTSATSSGFPIVPAYAFQGLASEVAGAGNQPMGSLVSDAAGDLFGVTQTGGANSLGTIFEVAHGSGSFTTLASFSAITGGKPSVGLVADAAGNLYGATTTGGTSSQGTLFELPLNSSSITTLASFSGLNFAYVAGLAIDSAADLYAVLPYANGDYGGVYELPAGSHALTSLASFSSSLGNFPLGGVAVDSHGNVYGTDNDGGAHGGGTVYEIANGTNSVTTLGSFTTSSGDSPEGGVVLDGSGDIFGTTEAGGALGFGTVYELPAGGSTVTALASFTASTGDNVGDLSMDPEGDLFGAAFNAGANNDGTVYELPAGAQSLAVLTAFAGANGNGPDGRLTIDNNGDLFDTTATGGINNTGTVFEISPQAHAVFTQGPTNTLAGSTITPAVTVGFQDPYGNTVTVINSNITVGIGTNAGGGALSGTATIGAVNGVATFNNLSINQPGVGYTLTATDAPFTAATSAPFNITALVPTAAVSGNGNAIADGESSPSATNATSFGTPLKGSASVVETYTVSNAGNATLTLGTVTAPAGYTLTQPLSTSLAPNASTTFTVTLPTTATGTFSGNVSIPTNDPNNNPYVFEITGTVTVPVAAVTGNSNPIANGESSPSTANGTSFGTPAQGSTQVNHTFFISNKGTGPLTIGTVTVPNGFVLVTGPSSPVAPGLSTSFTIGLPTATGGTISGNVSIVTSDPNNNPYVFEVSGTVTVPVAAVSGGAGQPIANGSTVLSTTLGTDFGSATQAVAGTIEHTFTITNNGGATLNLSSVSVPTGFELINGPLSSVAPGGFTTFNVGLYLANVGTFTGNVSFTSNDLTNTPYVFEVTGTVTAPTPRAGVTGGSNQPIIDGETNTSTLNGTSFGSVAQGAAQVDQTYTITCFGGASLTIGTPTLPAGFVLVSAPAATLAINASTTFTVGMNTATVGSYSGNVSFATNDPNNNPFVFAIAGTVTGPPEPIASVSGNAQPIADGESSPGTTNATSFGTPIEGSASVVETYTVQNTGNATLTLGTVTAPAGFTLTQPVSASVAPNASTTFTVTLPTASLGTFSGNVSIPTNDPNNNPYVFKITGTVTLPTIAVTGNGNAIADGESSPSGTNATNFGTPAKGMASVVETYTITNAGNTTLTLGTATAPAGYTLTQPLATSLAPNASTTFTVTLPTTTLGTFTGNVSIPTNDPNNNPYVFEVTGVVGTPIMSVTGDGIPVTDQSFTPTTSNGTDFGSALEGGPATVETYTITNSGNGTLTLGTVIAPTGYMATQPVSTSLAPNTSTTFTVALQTGTGGSFPGGVSVPNNDPAHGPYDFAITGIVSTVGVTGNGQPIANGTGGSTSNGTNFGTVTGGSPTVDETYTITNYGTTPLSIGNVTIIGQFVLVSAPAASIAVGSSSTFTVGFPTTTGNGQKAATVSFATGDPNNNPFTFGVGGTIMAPTAVVEDNITAVTYGSTTTSTSNGTNFGTVAGGSAGPTTTFTIWNTGTEALNITGNITVPAGFSVTQPLSTSLAPNATTTFSVTLTTGVPGNFSGNVSIPDNDIPHDPFIFAVSGTVNAPTAAVTGNGQPIADGESSPSATNATSFGTPVESSASVVETYTITNTGNATLTLGTVTAPTGYTLAQPLSASLAPNASTTFTVTLPTTTLGTFTGSVSIPTNDPNNNPYVFAISGTVTAPTAAVTGNANAIADGSTIPSTSNATSFGATFQSLAAITETYTVANTGAATLTLGTVTVPGGFALTQPLSTSIAPGSSTTFTVTMPTGTLGTFSGNVSIPTNDPANNPYVFAITGTVSAAPTLSNPTVTQKAKSLTLPAGAQTYLYGEVAGGGNTTLALASGSTQTLNDAAGFLGAGLGVTPLNSNSFTTSTSYYAIAGVGVSGYSAMQSYSGTFVNTGAGSITSGTFHASVNFTLTQPALVVGLGLGSSFQAISFNLSAAGLVTDTAPASTDSAAGIAHVILGPGNYTLTENTTVSGSQGQSHMADLLGVYVFTVNPPAPTAAVTGNGQAIADGESSPSAGNATSFGAVTQGASSVTNTYTITNSGTATLALGTVTVPAGFTLTQPLSTSIAPGGSTTFTVTLPTSSVGTFSGNVSIPTSDANNNPYLFKITGTINAASPTAAVTGNGRPIADGESSPSASNATSFGSVIQGASSVTNTYTVTNSGTATLTLGTVTVPAGFNVTQPLISSIAPGSSTTFTVTLPTGSVSTFSGNVSIPTNDANNNPYVFAITGTVISASAPSASVSGNGNAIADGSTIPSTSNATSFGATFQSLAAITETYTVANTGAATLTLGTVTVPGGFALTQPLSTSIAPGSSTTFTVTMPTGTLGTFSGNVSIPTNDPANNPYVFAITGTVSAAPTLSNPTVTQKAKSLTLPAGAQTYLYGEVAGGGNTTSALASGSTQTLNDAAGFLGAGLGVTPLNSNSFTTSTSYYAIAGVGVSGYSAMQSYSGTFVNTGAGSITSGTFHASVNFTLTQPALVVGLGLGSSFQAISFNLSAAGLVTDTAPASTDSAAGIAHVILGPGNYTLTENTTVSGSQGQSHMADLLGVYVFTVNTSQGALATFSAGGAGFSPAAGTGVGTAAATAPAATQAPGNTGPNNSSVTSLWSQPTDDAAPWQKKSLLALVSTTRLVLKPVTMAD